MTTEEIKQLCDKATADGLMYEYEKLRLQCF